MAAVRVLVTGHKGYIGAVLVPLLVERGHDVIGLDLDLFRSCTFGSPFANVPELVMDVRDVSRDDVEGFEAVLHLAAISNDPMGALDPKLTYAINYEASLRLASIAQLAGCARFIFSSSCSNYGAAGDAFATEESPLHPLTAYARSKMLTEMTVRELATPHFSPVFLRNATAYGDSPRLRTDLVVNNLAAQAFTTGRVVIRSDGTPWRPLVHVRDIAAAFIAALEAPREAVHNETFNIGRTSENYQVRDVANLVAEALPGTRIEYASGAAPDARNYRVSFAKAEDRLPGFAPRWTVRDGVFELLEAFAHAELRAEDVDGPRGARMACLQQERGQARVPVVHG